MHLRSIAAQLHLSYPHDTPITDIVIDSRKVSPGSLFIAIKGAKQNGITFAKDAESRGAAAIICAHPIGGLHIPELVVPDPIIALGKIAALHRSYFSLPVIALTGSNGKTSVKEMIYSIFPKPALASAGNLNNHLGVPLSLLKLEPIHHYAVFELGANHVGEIAYTAALTNPDVALVNNIAPAHIGEFGSIEHIAQAKGEIYAALPPAGVAVINEDDHFAHHWDSLLTSRTCLRYSVHQKADVYAKKVRTNRDSVTFTLYTPTWQATVKLPVPGQHHVSNALAAAACCYAVGIHQQDILNGLTQFHGVKGRQTFLKGYNDATIIDDSYNANLYSVLAAIELLAARKGKRILVLGDMGELGPYAEAHHQQVGLTAKQKRIDLLFTCGHLTKTTATHFGSGATHYDTQEALIHAIKPQLDHQTTVLIKGSRAAAMEHLVAALIPPTT